MIDLTTKTVDEINGLIQKYTPVLQLYVNQPNHIPYLAYILDISINHIKEKYLDLDINWKIWAVNIVEKQYFRGRINTEIDITKTIDDFINYYNKEYQNYCDGLEMSASEFDREFCFIKGFI